LQYVDAVKEGTIDKFFTEAFVMQNACYEATASNIASFDPISSLNLFVPHPGWNDSYSDQTNLESLLAWKQRELLKEFVDALPVKKKPKSSNDVAMLEASPAFGIFLHEKRSEMIASLRHETTRLGKHVGNDALFKTVVDDDLKITARA
jgi:hypothetical protein